jgi:hypothetical protein
MSNEARNQTSKTEWLKALGSIMTPLIVAALGFYFSYTLDKQQENEASTRLYTELISKREQAESDLRKEMFNYIIGTFLDKDRGKLSDKVFNLELLAYNFHKSFNLMPIFKQLDREIEIVDTSRSAKAQYRNRLQKVAREITSKQVAALESAGEKIELIIDFAEPKDIRVIHLENSTKDNTAFQLFPFKMAIHRKGSDPIQRYGSFKVNDVLPDSKELDVALEIKTPRDPKRIAEWEASLGEQPAKDAYLDSLERVLLEAANPDLSQAAPGRGFAKPQPPDSLFKQIALEFRVNYFDFPMIDNVRLSGDERCAVVLTDFDANNALAYLTIIGFPGSHASLKEKPYYDEVVEKLLE